MSTDTGDRLTRAGPMAQRSPRDRAVELLSEKLAEMQGLAHAARLTQEQREQTAAIVDAIIEAARAS
jgi:hypothetical protein